MLRNNRSTVTMIDDLIYSSCNLLINLGLSAIPYFPDQEVLDRSIMDIGSGSQFGIGDFRKVTRRQHLSAK
jgi:hypothetical protein